MTFLEAIESVRNGFLIARTGEKELLSLRTLETLRQEQIFTWEDICAEDWETFSPEIKMTKKDIQAALEKAIVREENIEMFDEDRFFKELGL